MSIILAIMVITFITLTTTFLARKIATARKERLREMAYAEYLSQLQRKMAHRIN